MLSVGKVIVFSRFVAIFGEKNVALLVKIFWGEITFFAASLIYYKRERDIEVLA